MRDWCLVVDCSSVNAAERVRQEMTGAGADVDFSRFNGRVWCFADTEASVRDFAGRLPGIVGRDDLLAPPTIRAWSEKHHRYVDPDAPDEDPDSRSLGIEALAPQDVAWRVRLDLDAVFASSDLRRDLAFLRRPVVGSGIRHIDLGARDEVDASRIAARVWSLPGVRSTAASAINGRIRLWWIRQNLAANYGTGGDGAGGDGWGGHGGGGHGGGGHGGH